MWLANLVFLAVGLILISRMGSTTPTFAVHGISKLARLFPRRRENLETFTV